ncbi:hypothetical protein N0V94_002500 [Neodidymelliopsis sp. IMI 364377]|nr:hypothetical protein N0V94_002500 [Neodidymelliopsis sp. IMI 364377]
MLVDLISQARPGYGKFQRDHPSTLDAMVTLVDLLSTTYAPIQAMILPYLGVAEVIALSRTCKGFDQLQPMLKATAYNIDHHLKRFFTDPKEFRSALGKCGGLIVGPFARQFLARTLYHCNTLELFVEDVDNNWDPLIDFLLNEGYEESWQRLGSFTRKDAGRKDRHIILHYSGNATIASLFDDTLTAAGFNFISCNKAYSIFPYNTLIKKESFMITDLGEKSIHHLNALSEEGIKTKTVFWDQRRITWDERRETRRDPENYHDPDPLTKRRRIGDRDTWMLELDSCDIQSPDVPDDVLKSTTFRLSIRWKYQQNWRVACYAIEYDETIRHPVLKHQYVTLAEELIDDHYQPRLDEFGDRQRTSHYGRRCQELKDRLDELTLLEHTKIPVAERPSQHRELVSSVEDAHQTRGKFMLPDTWTFYDEDIITFLHKIWLEQQKLDEQEEKKREMKDQDATGEKRVTRLLQKLLSLTKG